MESKNGSLSGISYPVDYIIKSAVVMVFAIYSHFIGGPIRLLQRITDGCYRPQATISGVTTNWPELAQNGHIVQ